MGHENLKDLLVVTVDVAVVVVVVVIVVVVVVDVVVVVGVVVVLLGLLDAIKVDDGRLETVVGTSGDWVVTVPSSASSASLSTPEEASARSKINFSESPG